MKTKTEEAGRRRIFLRPLVSAFSLFWLGALAFHSVAWSAEDAGESIVITSGSDGGLYQYTSRTLADILNRGVEGFEGAPELEVHKSGGSIDNLGRLVRGQAELAILQSDVLFRYLECVEREEKDIEEGAVTDKEFLAVCNEARGKKDLEIVAIASLFPEFTQIIVNKNSNIENVIQLAGRALFLGKGGSGTEVNAKAVLDGAGISDEDYVRVDASNYSNNQAVKAVCDGFSIDATFRVTSTIYPKLQDFRDCLRLIELDPELQSKITKKHTYYASSTINVDGDDVSTLFTRAVLVANKQNLGLLLPEERQVEALTRVIVDQLPAAFQKGGKGGNAIMFSGRKIVAGLPIPFHPVSRQFYEERGFLKNNRWQWIITFLLLWGTVAAIKMNTASRTPHEEYYYARHSNFVSFLYEITLGQAEWLLTLLRNSLASLWRSIRDFSFFQSPITVTIYGLFVFLWVAMLTILHFESMHALTRDIPNEFDNIDLSDFSIWLLQILSLGESPDGLFPKSFMAKTVTIIIPIIGVIGAILAVLMATIREKSAKERRARGLEVPALSDHLVVCGWNEHGVRVMEEISIDMPGSKPKHIVLLADSDREKPLEDRGLTRENIHFYRGMSSDTEKLESVNTAKAGGFLVLAGERKVNHRNFRSIFTVKMIANRLSEVSGKPRPKIMVDMVFKENLDMFCAAGADAVLNTRMIGTVFLAFSSLNMGFSNVITSLMSLATRPVISRVSADDRPKLLGRVAGMKFSRAWGELFASGINLLAIYPRDGEPSATMGIYPDLPDPVIMGEDDYVIGREDSLIIIENQALRKEKVGSISFADSHTDRQVGLSSETPIVVIDSRNEARRELKGLLDLKCPELFYICKNDSPGGESGDSFISWDGEIDSINGLVQSQVLDRLAARKYDGKIKFLIPTVEDPIQFTAQNAVHQDDATVALVLQLNALDSERFHYIAEIQCLDNLRLFKGVGVQQPIPVHEFASLALTKMTMFGGEVIGLILRYMENFFTGGLEEKSLRKIPLSSTPAGEALVGMTFATAARTLFGHGTQLLAIMTHDADDDTPVLVSLPHKLDSDFTYRIRPEDELFVIS